MYTTDGTHKAKRREVDRYEFLVYLCWPLASSIGQTTQHDSQASCAHTTMILSSNKVARDMRSSITPCYPVPLSL